MKQRLLPLAVVLVAVGIGLFASASTSSGAFHLMRVYAVNGGAFGDANIQYVELRMTDAGQNFVNTTDICFFDSAGAPYARFTFNSNPSNGADEASILVGTAEFDTNWPAGSPDFTFSAANTTAIAGGADVNHPLRAPNGKVAFGTDSATNPALMCQGSFGVIDSIAYGTGYTGTVNFGTKLNSDLPNAGTSGARLQGPICFPGSFSTPCAQPRDNSVDYAIVDVNMAANNPRNNSGQSGNLQAPIPADADGDGVPDVTDNCPDWPNPAQNLPLWSVPTGDTDCDGFPNTVTVAPRGNETFITTDPADHCADTATLNDENGPGQGEPLSPWPTDFNDDQRTNISDIVVFGTGFNKIAPDPLYLPRLDINADSRVNISDVVQFGPFFNKFCNV